MNISARLMCLALMATLLTTLPATTRAAETVDDFPDAIGEVVSLSGTVTAQRPGGALRVLDLKRQVTPKDVINTGPRSAVEIVFKDGSVFSQGPESRTILDEFVYSDTPSASKMLLNVGTGTFRYVTGQIVKQNPEGFSLRTTTATIGIRGTEVYSESSENGDEIGVLSMTPGHVVEVSTPGASRTLTRAGLSVRTTRDGGLSAPAPTHPETRARVIRAAPQTTQGETSSGSRSRGDLNRKVEAFREAVERSKGELGGLGDKPDYGQLHKIQLQKQGLSRAESDSHGASSGAGLGNTAGDTDTGTDDNDGGGQSETGGV